MQNSEITSIFEKRKQKVIDELRARRDEVYEKIPEVYELDRQISLLGVRLAKSVVSDDPDQRLEHISDTDKQIKLMCEQKKTLINDNGYNYDYLDPHYMCSDCHDTGFIDSPMGSKKCHCFLQLQIDIIYQHSNVKTLDTQNFSLFNEQLFSDNIDEEKYGIKISPRQSIMAIKKHCMDFINTFQEVGGNSLLFSGKTGVGKTYMINCIAAELLSRHKTVLYQTAPELFNTITSVRRRSGSDDGDASGSLARIMDTELLIIDDLGTESETAARHSELFSIINSRLLANNNRTCRTIISTNLGMSQMLDRYTDRVMSRIVGSFDMFRFFGEDLRLKK